MAPLTKPKPVEPKLDGVVVKAGEGRVLPSVDRLHSSIEDKDGLEEREQCSEDDESNHRAALDPRDHQDAQPHAAETQDVDLNEGGEESRSALSSGGRKTRIAAGSDQWSSSGSRQTPPPRTSSRYQTSPYKTNPRNNPRVLPKGTPKDDNENISSDPLNTGGLFQLQPGESPKKNVSSTVTNGVEPRREEKPYLEEIERLRKRLSMKSAEITQYIAEIQIKNDIMEKQNNKIRDLKREIQDQEVTHSEDTHRKEQQTKRIRQQASTIREQDQRIQDLEIQVQQLQDENAEKSKTNKDLNDAWRRATNELARLSQQNQVYKVDDTTLMGMYEGIIYSAGNWAANYCAGRGRKTFSQDELSPLKPLTMYYAQYAASEKLRPVLMQSLIVKKLAMTVLNYSDIEPVGCLWAGRLSPGLRQIQKGLEPGEACAVPGLLAAGHIRVPDVKEFAAWKAKTAHLVSNAVDQDELDLLVGDVIARLKADLRPFVTARGPRAWADLEEVVQKAVELDGELSKSRALFTFDNFVGNGVEAWGFPFDEGTTASVDGFEPAKSGMNVELVVAPFFTKTGTADGDHYDRLKVLGKCIVLCTESRMKLEKF